MGIFFNILSDSLYFEQHLEDFSVNFVLNVGMFVMKCFTNFVASPETIHRYFEGFCP